MYFDRNGFAFKIYPLQFSLLDFSSILTANVPCVIGKGQLRISARFWGRFVFLLEKGANAVVMVLAGFGSKRVANN